MDCPVAYDITRLATRVLNRTPNGIDRIDSAFARRLLGSATAGHLAMMMTLQGPRIISGAAAADVVNGIFLHWGEDEAPGEDESYRRIVNWLSGETSSFKAAQRVARGRSGQASGVARWIRQHGFPIGQSPVAALPKGARYLNVSQFPLWIPSYFRWLKQRPDVKGVFFIHDLLPIEHPEYFRKAEYDRHLRRLVNLAEFGAAAIVTTQVVKEALQAHLAPLGRKDMPILVAPIPAAPIFSDRRAASLELTDSPYFVACGTIEPRKNHLLLLHVWRELVRRDGASAPKLVLIGARGWENENVVDLLERCHAIGNHVIEVSGLSTPGLKALMGGARALLMPSFAEGYGLPIAEALAVGTPVIASDIAAFEESGAGRITALSPIDGEKWLETIRAFTAPNSPERAAAKAQTDRFEAPSWSGYFAKAEAFLSDL
ncbi:glycosyltransferase family 4 protein [Methylocella tundrae]|nr:glycosyltransferase family 1 protein [Methylocella tundrae]